MPFDVDSTATGKVPGKKKKRKKRQEKTRGEECGKKF